MNRILDRSLDAAVVPGYSRVGYSLRGLSWDTAVAGDLRGRTALVTGATSGIGEAVCEGLLLAGANVRVIGRDPKRLDATLTRLSARVPDALERLRPGLCDISDLEDVRSFSDSILADGHPVDVLVNNAGVLPPSRLHTAEGLELAFATNVIGPFLLTSLLLPALMDADDSRVITVSSGGMYTARLRADDLQLEDEPYSGTRAYAHTKRMEVILSRLWSDHHGGDGIGFHSMHPGWVATPGLSSSLPAFARAMRPILRTPQQGADTIVWLATSSLPGSAGGSFWHDRARRPEHRLPGTRESESDRTLLWEACEELAALPKPVAHPARAA
jgi:dehydrogenase/reductase SDR family member 12